MCEATTGEEPQSPPADAAAALSAALARAEQATAEVQRLRAQVEQLERERDLYRPRRLMLEAITDRVLAGILVLDGNDFRAKWANPACRRMLDEPYRTQVDILGLPVGEFLPGADAIGLTALLRQVAASGEPLAAPETEYAGFERGVTYWRWSIVPLPATPGAAPDLLLVANELTEQVTGRRRVEALAERLAAGQRFLSGIMDNIPATIMYIDKDLVCRQCNQAAAAEMGRPAEMIVGQPLRGLHPGNPQVWQAVESVLRTGQAFRVQELPITRPGQAGAGTQYYTVDYVPDFDDAGRVCGVIVEGQRVTPLVEARQQVQEARDRLEERVRERTAELSSAVDTLRLQASIVANVTDAVVATDASGGIVLFNRAAEELYGRAAAEVIGRLPGEVLSSEFSGLARAEVYRQIREKGRWRGEVIVHRRDGTSTYADAIGVLLRDDSGQVIGRLVVCRDISARKQAEEAMRESQAQLQAYSRRLVEAIENERRSLARELHDQAGQSMSAVKLSLGRLRREVDVSGEQAARFAEIGQLVDDVMDDLHRLAMNLRPASLDRYGLLPALEQYVEFYRRQSGLEVNLMGVGMEERLPAEVETAVYRVVQEALTNVMRHARATRVEVVLERRGERVTAIVEDNGQGFDVEEAMCCGRLGLLGMRERAALLGGELTIESRPGEGTAVYMQVLVREA